MIIFLSNPTIGDAIVDRFYGLYGSRIVTLNLSSPYKCQYDITSMITRINQIMRTNGYTIDLSYLDTPEFDTSYYNMIINDTELFYNFMRIMVHEFEDILVLVYVSTNAFAESITESIIKLIQQRYGKNAWKVTDIEDVYAINMSETFTPQGIQVLDEDIKRINMAVYAGKVPPIIPQYGKETYYGKE